jgi:hypothetical protein
MVQKLIQSVLIKGIATEVKETVIVPVYKNGIKTLLSTLYKTVFNILLSILSAHSTWNYNGAMHQLLIGSKKICDSQQKSKYYPIL